MQHSNYFESLYKGFCATKVLWYDSYNELQQLHTFEVKEFKFLRPITKKLRLGQMAEQFAFNQLEQLDYCKILVENLQIQKQKQTLGELDAVIEYDKEVIHLEIIYKFYLYDETLGTSELERWIGPNRNDSLIQKITKLKNKQLPLLYSTECKSVINELRLDISSIQQRVLFKAQLYVPYQATVNFKNLNEACVCGFYIHKEQLDEFKTSLFYMPPKLDWFLEINDDVKWLNFESFKTDVMVFLKASKSPLVWIKQPNEHVLKCFLVWW